MFRSTDLNLVHIVRPATEQPRGDRKLTPGLLLLHGRGADEADLMGLEAGLDPRLTIVSARAPFRLGPGFAWYDMARVGHPDREGIAASLKALTEFTGAITEKYSIDPERVHLMGFSQGGIMSAALALTLPGRFAGVAMHSSYVPTEADLPVNPEAVRDVPFFVAHGTYDQVIPVEMGRTGAEYLRGAGANVTYQEYPIGHGISEESLYDLSEWLTNLLEKTRDQGLGAGDQGMKREA